MVASQVDVVLTGRRAVPAWPPQRLAAWVNALQAVRPELSHEEAQAAIHAIFALIQSPLRHRTTLPRPVMRDILMRMALAGLYEARV